MKKETMLFSVAVFTALIVLASTDSQVEVVYADSSLNQSLSNTSGKWGTAPTTFDSKTGALTVLSGTISSATPGDSTINLGNSTAVKKDKILTINFEDGVQLPENSNSLFENFSKLTRINGKLDTSKVNSMTAMFSGASSLTSLDVSKWETSKVNNMAQMFSGASSLTSLDVSKWDTSKVNNMTQMFVQASSLTSLDVSKWDTSKVNNMTQMFAGASSLTSLDVSKWDTSKVVSMTAMFLEDSSLASLDVSKWDTSKVVDMSSVFLGASSLTSLDVSKWDISKVADMSSLFSGASSLTSLDFSNWNTSNVEDMSSMFSGASKIQSLSLGENSILNKDVELPSINNSDTKYSGRWERLDSNPKFTYDSSDDFMMEYNGNYTGVYIWEKKETYINGSDFSMYVGDKTPTASDFKASATDKDGKTSEVTVDLSKADLTKAGTYDVTLKSAEGQSKVVKLTVKANPVPNKKLGVYRAYNPNSGEHLYTTSVYEYKDVILKGWKAEGLRWFSPVTGTPVYRAYNPNSGEHFYTMSLYEYNQVTSKGWRKEGIGFYTDPNKGVPIYRNFNPNATGPGSHLYTQSEYEYKALGKIGWHKEGIAFYGMK
ncbi:BspA family leucine-rich repeat surface protein [Lactococcus lactis]|uniref:BspA family leucine-rich repeat surface protein n=1 Tax=Lactococcus lactis TaxID=1358 RepID=UPI00223A7F8E|nr:BspA family leucine-rich repeat surface protein [Lactococcus lactis]MCT0449089.1 BspA family leucine-rich repeat surface protein [Lactococcus lactis subsp. lactis]